MGRILGSVVTTALFAAFSLANTQHVELSLVFGAPVEIRLIFLLFIAFGSGVFATIFQRMLHDARRRAQARRIRLRLQKGTSDGREPE